ncbi:hypothetical protein K503DRAFT_767570 [Rhizopogon vinicolor AM-OR11-026]|uniref:Uncharacterized protein n=1 Tax=Rhizopogon vinicolor AM-OR11-026 TaxID=1314800 RepID=A0A1B7N9R8_9AGAM|nr:hypothetical protein K503DRAFT_767570 [Rhizopogon vinicolor AM-OR11-026]
MIHGSWLPLNWRADIFFVGSLFGRTSVLLSCVSFGRTTHRCIPTLAHSGYLDVGVRNFNRQPELAKGFML